LNAILFPLSIVDEEKCRVILGKAESIKVLASFECSIPPRGTNLRTLPYNSIVISDIYIHSNEEIKCKTALEIETCLHHNVPVTVEIKPIECSSKKLKIFVTMQDLSYQ